MFDDVLNELYWASEPVVIMPVTIYQVSLLEVIIYDVFELGKDYRIFYVVGYVL